MACRLDNNDCIVTDCSDNCCNTHGYCPSDYDSSLYSWTYTQCWYDYSCENSSGGGDNSTLALALGLTGGILFMAIIFIAVCCYIKYRKKK